MSCNYGCSTLPPHQQVVCGDYQLGGMSAMFFLECDHTITDYTSQIQWNENIANGKAFIVMGVKADIPTPAANMQDNPIACGAEQTVQGYDNTLHCVDKNVLAANDDHYAKLNGRKMYVGGFLCEEDKILVSNTKATFNATPRTVPANNREMQFYDITCMFYSKVKEIPFAEYDAPAGIFDEA